MGELSPWHIAIVVVIGLLVFGPKKLPELGRGIGSGLRDFRKGLSGEADPPAPVVEAASTPVVATTTTAAPVEVPVAEAAAAPVAEAAAPVAEQAPPAADTPPQA